MFIRSFLANKKRVQQLSLGLVVSAITITGIYLFAFSHAASPYTIFNADNGTLASGAKAQTCSGANDGSCVVFDGSSGNTSSIALGFAVFNTESDSNGTPSTAFAEYANSVGKLPNFVEWFMAWPNSGAGSGTSSSSSPLYWGSQASQIEADKLTPVISWGSNGVSLNSIVSGSQDSSVLAPAAALAKAYPGTMYIRFDWEMNGAWSAYSPVNSAQPAGETPATFVAAWQHVVNYFRSAGVTNVKWVWAPNVDGGLGNSGCSAPGSTTACMAAYYPGDSYVDYVGLDGYNYAYTQGTSNPWLTPSQVFSASYAELEGITQKPVIITETSSVEANSSEVSQGFSKAQWIGQLSSYLPTLSNIAGVCWFNQPATVGSSVVDFGVDTSAASLAAWNQYFVNNSEYQGKLP